MYALLSVSDKRGVVDFANSLIKLGYKIVSTGGTFLTLRENGVEVIEVSEITKFAECFNGRVKTLHPMIHGGILNKRDDTNHQEQKKRLGIEDIDLVCVNLYPFKQCVLNNATFDELIENIDIGGPTMIRAAAKNFKDVIVVTNYEDYTPIIDALVNDTCDYEFRKSLMIKAYEHTASYDCFIANHFNEYTYTNNEKMPTTKLPNKLFIVGDKVMNTKYGENPHQKGALYQNDGLDGDFLDDFHIIKGEPSFNNLLDLSNALKITTSLLDNDKKAITIVKHGNPCGFALSNSNEDISQLFDKALVCDSVSAYGGVMCVSEIVDKEFADKIKQSGIYFEVIYAPFFTAEALEVFQCKKRIKLFAQYSNEQILQCKKNGIKPMLKIKKSAHSYKQIDGGILYQQSDKILQDEVINSELKTPNKASAEQMQDMIIANAISALSKSNCIVFVKDATLLAIGMGMTSRVDATHSAIKKAQDMKVDLSGCIMASEAFFPFKDSIELGAKIGVACIIEPGGSIRDDEVIECAKENNIVLYFTHRRHFLH